MEKIKIDNIKLNDGIIEIPFDSNHNVVKVKANLKHENSCDITVKYAINGILSDLVLYGGINDVCSGEFCVEIDTPATASHIYIIPSDKAALISDIEIFEVKDILVAEYYPSVKDFDLGENYYLDTISVFLPTDGYFHYSVYTSMDGRNFKLLTVKNSNESSAKDGDTYDANGIEARLIRVYIEYNSNSVEAVLNDLTFTGRKSNSLVLKRPEINICDFESSEFNVKISDEDTYEEVYGIIDRRLGEKFRDWFILKLEKNPVDGHDFDYFELSDCQRKILIKGNNGISLAVGLNHYLKYYCKVNISQVGDNVKMPEKIVFLNKRVFKETRAKVRYSYNYCTLSYSMAFWGEKEWRDELDWLALNGVNAVLDATAQEEVWRRFLGGLGYTHEEIKKYIAGPAYYAWAYMANLFGFGGPVHDSWFEERTHLARTNHLIMRKLGMYPVLQGYSGMVPVDICDHDKTADIIPQGIWCSFVRPSMLKTTSPVFREYAEKFYKAQKEVYGSYSIYFATDPFHEGGITAGMSMRNISSEVIGAMLKSNKDAVWIIQSWQSNPTSELLLGLDDIENGKEHALILDLYAEKLPNYNKGCEGSFAFGYSREFDHTPWLFCMLNNFGGRLGLHGHLDNMAKWIPEAYNTCEKIAGIGITPEASVNNPVLYDFLFECIWVDDATEKMQEINLKNWLYSYAERRYGKSKSAESAWDILKETVYKGELNNLGQGAPESVLNARPSLEVSAASTWGNAIVSYDKSELKKAAKLLLEDYEKLKDSDGYIYDLITVLQQVLSNDAQDVYSIMVEAYKEKNASKLKENADKFLKIADSMEAVTGSSKYYMLGRWVEQAKALAKNTDDFTKRLYEFNAKALVTTWGAFNQSEVGRLHDYSNRQWSGLIGDFYKPRWERWIESKLNELSNKPFEENINWFEWEWNWVRQNTLYPVEPLKVNLLALGNEILG